MPPTSRPTVPPQAAKLLAKATRHLRAGRPADAIGPLRAAAGWLPGNAGVLHDLGLACLECGLIDDAIAALQGAVAADPAFADSHLRLGIALEAAGAPEAALLTYTMASTLCPSLADASYRAGDLFDSLGRTQQAIDAFRRATASAPHNILGHIASAKALIAENRHREAETAIRRALALDGDNAAALDLLGNLLAESGRFEEARACLSRAIELAPLRAGSYYEIARGQRIGPGDADLVARMHAALALPGLEPAQRSRVHLALGKAADDLGDPAAAMQQFDAAEALRNTLLHFDPGAYEARVDRLIARFTPEVLAAASPAMADAPAPILILGLPRSGTTLVEQILSAHPMVCGGGELPFWTERGEIWDQSGAAGPTPAFLQNLAADYLHLLRGIGAGAAYVTDKMPLNIQWVGLIRAALPASIIIHCRRRPIDTALSIHQTHFNPRMPFPTGGAALVRTIRATQRLGAHWRVVLPASHFIEVAYEALVSAPEPAIRRLVGACGLAWDDACLRPERNARIVRTPSKWQARQPIHRGAIDRWRAYEPWLGPLHVLLDDDAKADNILT